jgi:SSS family solute:Na+ symporter
MLFALAPLDYAVVVGYIALLGYMGYHFARRQKSTDEYFLASRSVPWFALGLSIMATLMSSLTYLSEPGEVWMSGLTTIVGKVGAVLTEMVIVLLFIIPFLMRFRFTSAYEYLGYRFGPEVRNLGVVFFVALVVGWMGFVVLAMSWTVSNVTGVPLWAVTATVGVVGTVYTMVGGMRAVIWKEVIQVLLMMGGCLVCLGYVSYASGGSWLGDWLAEMTAYRRSKDPDGVAMRLFTLDPYERITVFTFGLTMFVWNLCTHLGNQMVVQRYFSSADMRAAKRSFVVAACASLLINTLLIFVGVALISFYLRNLAPFPVDPTSTRLKDLIFPSFMVNELPAGLAGAVLIAVLSAAMSTIDSGINAVSTVISVERRRLQGRDGPPAARGGDRPGDMLFARAVTLVAGLAITASAYWLNMLVKDRNILEMMPRSFNCFLMPLGGMFFIGFFMPWVGRRAAFAAAATAFATAVSIAYAKELYGVERNISFTWILPAAFTAAVLVGGLLGLVDRSTEAQRAGLTWFTRRQLPHIPHHLIADWVLKEHGKLPT